MAVTVTALLWCAGCASGAATTTGAHLVAVTGTVRVGPTCPGPELIDSPCPPKPIAGARVDAEQASRVIASVTTGSDGRFTLRLAPGGYDIVATAADVLGKTATTRITVASSPVSVDLVVDTGIR